MRKILRTFPFIILISGIIALILIYLNYYQVNFVLQNTSATVDSDSEYSFKVDAVQVQFISDDSNQMSLSVNIKNTGRILASSPQVYITFTNLSNSIPKTIACDIDLKGIEKGATATATIQFDVTELGVGSYNTYISIWDDKNSQHIPLVNPYRNTRDGYYFGMLHISHFHF